MIFFLGKQVAFSSAVRSFSSSLRLGTGTLAHACGRRPPHVLLSCGSSGTRTSSSISSQNIRTFNKSCGKRRSWVSLKKNRCTINNTITIASTTCPAQQTRKFPNNRCFQSSSKQQQQQQQQQQGNGSANNGTSDTTLSARFKAAWTRFLAPKEMPPRHTFAWYKEMLLICTVFGVTGTSTMVLVRPAVSKGLGIQGSIKDGPWSYRICSLIIMSPIYGALLVVVGTLFGRHAYFRYFAVKIFTRFGIPPELMDPMYHQNKKIFRKW